MCCNKQLKNTVKFLSFIEFNPVSKFDRKIVPIKLTIDGQLIKLEKDTNKDFFELYKILLDKIYAASKTLEDVTRELNINPDSN